MTQVRITIGARMRLQALAERAPGERSLSDLIDLLSHAEPHHLADIMTAATAADIMTAATAAEEEREEERRRIEWAKRVEEAKELAPRILDGLEAAGTHVDRWLVEGKHDGGPLMVEVIRLWRERREAGGAGE